MTKVNIQTFYLSDPTNCDFSATCFGKLKMIVLQEYQRTSNFTVLDTFTQDLRRSGQLLFQTLDELQLLSAGGQILSQPTTGGQQFVDQIASGPVKDSLSGISSLRRLLPVGSGTLQEKVLALMDEELKTHARAHLLLLEPKQGNAAGIVVTKGLRGYGKSLKLLRKVILECGGAEVDSPKLYPHLFPEYRKYTTKPQVGIGYGEPAFASATKIISNFLSVARANEKGILADHDTEFLHDYRVALRKVRSVLSLFKGVYDQEQTLDLKNRFSVQMAATGRLRDLDVYLLDKQKFYGLLPQNLSPGLDAMFGQFAAEREAALESLTKKLRSKAYRKEMKALEQIFAIPKSLAPGAKANLGAHDFAMELIWKRYNKVRKTADRIGAHTPDEDVHELRIMCKKLRYLMEFFAPVFPKQDFKAAVEPLKDLQDNLGKFNDYSVQQENLNAFLTSLRAQRETETLHIAQSVGALIAVLYTSQKEERRKVTQKLQGFNSMRTKETFRCLFYYRNHKK